MRTICNRIIIHAKSAPELAVKKVLMEIRHTIIKIHLKLSNSRVIISTVLQIDGDEVEIGVVTTHTLNHISRIIRQPRKLFYCAMRIVRHLDHAQRRGFWSRRTST